MDVLVSMGFAQAAAEGALEAAAGNVELALDLLLQSGGSGPAAGEESAGTPRRRLVQSVPGGQYSAGARGRSACTCIALSAADRFLRETTAEGPAAAISEDFLAEALRAGTELHGRCLAAGGSVEHLSAEEVLASPASLEGLVSLSKVGDVRQGILSREGNGGALGLGMRSVLSRCREEADVAGGGWAAAVLTKSPETVLLLLPGALGGEYLLVDSHPRSQLPETTGKGAYVMAHATELDLAGTLEELFPATDLGPDVPELMAAMYNSFDAYLFVAKKG